MGSNPGCAFVSPGMISKPTDACPLTHTDRNKLRGLEGAQSPGISKSFVCDSNVQPVWQTPVMALQVRTSCFSQYPQLLPINSVHSWESLVKLYSSHKHFSYELVIQ